MALAESFLEAVSTRQNMLDKSPHFKMEPTGDQRHTSYRNTQSRKHVPQINRVKIDVAADATALPVTSRPWAHPQMHLRFGLSRKPKNAILGERKNRGLPKCLPPLMT